MIAVRRLWSPSLRHSCSSQRPTQGDLRSAKYARRPYALPPPLPWISFSFSLSIPQATLSRSSTISTTQLISVDIIIILVLFINLSLLPFLRRFFSPSPPWQFILRMSCITGWKLINFPQHNLSQQGFQLLLPSLPSFSVRDFKWLFFFIIYSLLLIIIDHYVCYILYNNCQFL